MNWMVSGRTSLKVGFESEGSVYEGGNCKHLKRGDQAYGYSGEADSFGEERYLMCLKCFEAFKEARKVEPTECADCCREFPRNTLNRYIPYFLDGSRSEQEDAKLWLCNDCCASPRHQERLENDRVMEEMDDLGDDQLFDDDDDDEGPWEPAPRLQWTHVVFDKVENILPDPNQRRPYSSCIQSIVVVGYDPE